MRKLTNKEKLNKLSQALFAMDDYAVSKEDFIKQVKRLLEFLKKIKSKNKEDFEDFNRSVSEAIIKIEGSNLANTSELTNKFVKTINEALKEQEDGMNFIRDKVRNLKEGKDGKDANEKKIVKNVLAKLPEYKETILDNPFQIANKLETLKDETRLKISAIDKLQEELDELKNRPTGGGGTRKVVYTKRINLSAQCNGTLKEFLMPKDTLSVIGVWGTQFPITFDEADFTFEGRTLTLTSEVGAPQTGQTLFALIQTNFYG